MIVLVPETGDERFIKDATLIEEIKKDVEESKKRKEPKTVKDYFYPQMKAWEL